MPSVFIELPFFAASFFLGIFHALEPDHVVTVSAIVNQAKNISASAFAGILWGIGHTTAILIAGFILLALKISTPENLSNFFEINVGLLLIVLGLSTILKLFNGNVHRHIHVHGQKRHTHFHSHTESRKHNHAHKSFFIGIIQGLAGTASIIILTITAVSSLADGLLYIIIFGMGSIIGMFLVSMAIHISMKLVSNAPKAQNVLSGFIGITSIILGFSMAFGGIALSL